MACAASGKSGGFLALDWCDGSPLGPLARASFALHAELATEIGIDYGYRRMDTFMLAARERGTPAGGHRVAAPALARRRRDRHRGARLARRPRPRSRRPASPRHCSTRRGLAAPGFASAWSRTWRGAAAPRPACVTADGETLEGDAVVLAMGPWTGRLAGRLRAAQRLRAQGLQRDARRARRARPRALRRLPHRRRPRARAGDLSAARRRGLRVRHGRSGAAAGFAGGRRGERELRCAVLARAAGRVSDGARRRAGHAPAGLLPSGHRRRRCR